MTTDGLSQNETAAGDMELVRDYAALNSETAFASLVRRHVNLVYSVALRQVRDTHLAEEITQAVFVILARKAKSLGEKTILSGWLCRTARYVSQNALTIQRRRERREQEAHDMQTILNEPSTNENWIQIAPLLESALAKLSAKDHDAIVLRFFEGKDLREVGVALGASEDAAKKRVSRALEKLRQFFFKRGVNSTTTTIAEQISANSIQVAPAALAKAVTATALVKGIGASSSTLTLIKGALKIMAWTKAKSAAVAGVVAILAIGTTTVAVKTVEHRNSQKLETYFNKMDSAYLDTAPPMVLVRPSKYANRGNYVITDNGGKMMRRGTSFTELLTAAYGFGPEQMILPSNLPQGQFDMLLTAPNNQQQALQAQLKKQFGIVAHTETRDTDVLVLKCVNPHAPGLKITSGGGPNIWTRNDGVKLQGYRISDPGGFDVVHLLGNLYSKPVIDETGLTDAYDIDVHWNSNLNGNDLRKQIETILREQFGLELTPANRPMDMLVVEKTK